MSTYMRERQIKEFEIEKQVLEQKLTNAAIQDKGMVRRQLGSITETLNSQQAPDLTPEQRDAWAREERELRERITHGMPSDRDMRTNAPGVVGHHMRWEKKYKKDILRWKNIRIALHKGDEDPDLANLEMYRPKRDIFNHDNAQVPVKTVSMPTDAFKQGHDLVDWDGEGSAVEKDAVLLKQIADLQKKIDKLQAAEDKRAEDSKLNLSDEERERRRNHMIEINARRKARVEAEALEAAQQPREPDPEQPVA